MEIKRLFAELEAAEIDMDKIDAIYELDAENEEVENAWMKAYEKENEAFEALVNEIVTISAGMIDTKTARVMIRVKRNELKSLIARIA